MRSTVLIRHNLALLAREPGPVLSRIGMPLVLITVLRPLFEAALGDDALSQGITGMLVFFSLLGLSLIGGGVLTERNWRTLDRLRSSPARPREILIGKAVPYGGVLIAQQAVVIGYGVALLGLQVRRWDLLVLAGVTWAVTLLCAGAALATVVANHSGLSAATDIGGLVLTVLGGAMVPLNLLPSWVAAVAPVSPGYWALGALRASVAGDAVTTVRSVAVLAVAAAAFGSFAAWRLARGWGRGRPS